MSTSPIVGSAFGGAAPVSPKQLAVADPAARWTAASRERAFFAYATNYLIDLQNAVIVDVEATTAIRQAEVTAQRRVIERTQERFGLWPERLVGDAGYGDAKNLSWLVEERGIEASEQLSAFAVFTCPDETVVRAALHHRSACLALLSAQAEWSKQRDAIARDVERPEAVTQAAAQGLAEALAVDDCLGTLADARHLQALHERLPCRPCP